MRGRWNCSSVRSWTRTTSLPSWTLLAIGASARSAPGGASVAGNDIELHTRGFQFYEGAEQSQRLRVRFSGDFVAGLSSANGSALPVVRLEPVLIGGLYPAHNEDRILIKLDQVPPYLVETLVAVEDREFFNHFGVSPKSIARAVWVNLTAGRSPGWQYPDPAVGQELLPDQRAQHDPQDHRSDDGGAA